METKNIKMKRQINRDNLKKLFSSKIFQFSAVLILIIVTRYFNVKDAVDALLAGGTCRAEERRVLDGKIRIVMASKVALPSITRAKDILEPPRRSRRKNG